MGKHVTTVVPAAQGWQGHCGCRATGKIVADFWKAEQWAFDHVLGVEATRRRLEKRGMSLEKTRDYYREKASDETETEHDRELWGQMADELDRRIGPAQMPGAEPLF